VDELQVDSEISPKFEELTKGCGPYSLLFRVEKVMEFNGLEVELVSFEVGLHICW